MSGIQFNFLRTIYSKRWKIEQMDGWMDVKIHEIQTQ